uniref:TonB-dependent receptor n=1 Tax=Novosphingobium sp. TaxID=1874826 RepID=UPI002606D036
GLRTTVGNYQTVIAEGYVNVPVSDKVAVRIAALYDARDSYFNEGTTRPAFPIQLPAGKSSSLPKFNDNISVRGTISYKPTSNLKIIVAGDYSKLRGGRYDYVRQSNFYDFPAQPSPPYPPGTGDASKPTYVNRGADAQLTMPFALPFDLERKDSSWGLRGEVTWSIGDITLTYLGSFRQYDRGGQLAFQLFDIPLLSKPDDTYKQNSQELRVSYDGSDKLKLQAGIFYFNERNRTDGPVNFGALSPLVGPIFGVMTPTNSLERRTPQNIRSDSWAVFSQGTYSLLDSLRLTLGVRYTQDKKAREGFDESRAGPVYNPATDVRFLNKGNVGFNRVTWRAGLDYDLGPQTLAFFNVSTGYKAGGTNDGCLAGSVGSNGLACARPANTSTFYYRPETLTSYESGIKGQIPSLGLGYQLTAFHYDYSNLQLLRVPSNVQDVARFENAANARNTGIELESLLRVDSHTTINTGVTYLNTELGDYTPLGAAGPNFKGRPLERAPEFTVNLRFRHTRPLLDGDITFAAGTRFSDKYFIYDYSSAVVFVQPSFFKSDAMVEYRWGSDRFSLAAYVNNIENYVEVGGIQGGSNLPGIGLIAGSAAPGQPRTWGMRAAVKF